MKLLGNLGTRNDCIERFSIGKIATTGSSQAALAAQAARDLARAVGAEIEVDAGILVANGGQRFTAIIGHDERNDKLVCHTSVVRLLHALHRVNGAASLAVALHHGIKRLLLAFPAAITVHGVITAFDGCDLACSEL